MRGCFQDQGDGTNRGTCGPTRAVLEGGEAAAAMGALGCLGCRRLPPVLGWMMMRVMGVSHCRSRSLQTGSGAANLKPASPPTAETGQTPRPIYCVARGLLRSRGVVPKGQARRDRRRVCDFFAAAALTEERKDRNRRRPDANSNPQHTQARARRRGTRPIDYVCVCGCVRVARALNRQPFTTLYALQSVDRYRSEQPEHASGGTVRHESRFLSN
jgi:hypothetical protein